ncbi:uncharacterized protein LOC143568058 [Bidens hawaiensis]|uniref:uncharacterized protein LOC143568058 n=1 Tax=Bidens hawaiensis TaxID=980011 RepID=UPI00404A42C6
MDLISCYSQYSVQVSESSSSSCSSFTPTSSCIVVSPNNNNLTPATQTSVSSLYKTTLSSGDHHFTTVTWHRNPTTADHHLHITSGNHQPTTIFRLNTHSGIFRKKKGTKALEINGSRVEICYDLSSAQYGAGAEPTEGYYVAILVNSELGLLVGDMSDEKIKTYKRIGKYCLISRKEYYSGNTLYSTKAKFSDAGNWHDIVIRCTGQNEGLKYPVLQVGIDKRVVIRVKRLQWNFRGNQTIFLDGLLVDLMWDVHDWFFSSESGSGSGRAVFMFRTRSGLDSRLWLEEKIVKGDDDNNDDKKTGFALLIYALLI